MDRVSPTIPIRDIAMSRSWEGVSHRKPWETEVTAVIPCLDTPECVEVLVELLSLQTIKPNIVLIDTGSTQKHIGALRELERLNEHVELHELRFKGVIHASDPVAIAMDLAFSACATPYLFATHADCFPMRKDLLEHLVSVMKLQDVPVAGHEITPRVGLEVAGWVGHTATMFDMGFCDEHGLGWSQRRCCKLSGNSHRGNSTLGGYPDTEFLINEQLDKLDQQFGKPHRFITGKEENYKTTKDDLITHVRSYVSAKVYSSDHFIRASRDMDEAMVVASKNILDRKSVV